MSHFVGTELWHGAHRHPERPRAAEVRLIVAAVASGQGLLTSNAGLDDSDWQVAVVPVQQGRFTLTFELPVTLPPFLYQDVQEVLTLAGGGPGRSYPPVTATPPELQVAPFNLYVYDQQGRSLGWLFHVFGDPKRSIRDRFNYARPGERYDLGSPVFSTRPGRVQGTYQGTRNDFGANKRLETEVVFDDTFALVYTYGRTSATRPTLAEVGYTTRTPEHGGRWLLVGKDCRELGRFATGFQTSSCVSTVFDDSDTR